jgi:endonuclease/exonuclease/phosphatase family metal-dependent hydrolase
LDTPVVFAGDFNDWNQKASRNLFDIAHFHDAYKTIHGDYARSFPSFYPWFKLDRIYTKGIQIKSAEVLTQNGWDKISDHLPILINGNI